LRLKRVLLNESGQILRHVITIGLIVLVIILILAEVGPLIWLRIFSIQDAEDIANSAAFQYKVFKNEQEAINEVASKMKTMGYTDEEIRQSTVLFLPAGPDEKTVARVTVVRYANTLITKHINALKRFARIATTKEASIATATEKQ
jgi:ABC-type glycerol-3-phosphate transport system permease component